MKSNHSLLLYSSLLSSFSLSLNFQIYYKVFESKKWKYFKYMAIKSIRPHTSLTKLFQPKWRSKSLRLKGSMVSFHKCWLSNLLNYCRLCKSLISTKKNYKLLYLHFYAFNWQYSRSGFDRVRVVHGVVG